MATRLDTLDRSAGRVVCRRGVWAIRALPVALILFVGSAPSGEESKYLSVLI